jgi:hypothetical protein
MLFYVISNRILNATHNLGLFPMQAETLINFLLVSLLSPAGFIGFCCGLARSLPTVLGGAIAATALETFLSVAVSSEPVDPLFVLVTPVAALFASACGWLAARVFAGKKNLNEPPVRDESVRLAYKHDVLEPGAVEDY